MIEAYEFETKDERHKINIKAITDWNCLQLIQEDKHRIMIPMFVQDNYLSIMKEFKNK